MFRQQQPPVTFHHSMAISFLVRANITLYEPRGDYQIIVESMQPVAKGCCNRKYEIAQSEVAG